MSDFFSSWIRPSLSKPYSRPARSSRSLMSSSTAPVASHVRASAHISAALFTKARSSRAFAPKLTSMTLKPWALRMSMTPPPTPPPSMKTASGWYRVIASAILPALSTVLMPRHLMGLTARPLRPLRKRMTLSSSPKRAMSTPATSGAPGSSNSRRRVCAASTSSTSMNWETPARGNTPRTRTRTKSLSSP